MSESNYATPAGVPSAAELVQANEDGQVMQWQLQQTRFVTSLDLAKDEDAVSWSRAMLPADQELIKMPGAVIDVADYVVHDAEVMDKESGELRPIIRCVFMDESGGTYSASGNAAQKFCAFLDARRRSGHWSPPVKMRVTTPISRYGPNSGRNYVALSLEPTRSVKSAPKNDKPKQPA